MHFGEYELFPSLIGLSPLPTGHPKTFQRQPVRTSTMCYHSFILPMGRSHGFASTITDYAAIFVGTGYMAQATYVFPSMWNVRFQYAVVDAGSQLAGLSEYTKQTNISGVLGYYVNRHRIKANVEFGTNQFVLYNKAGLKESNLYGRFNVELGI